MEKVPWTVSDILNATRGDLVCGDRTRTFFGIGIDSRKINPDELFIAIVGQNHDGHRFIGEVIDLGIRGIVMNQSQTTGDLREKWNAAGVVLIAVGDTRRALGDLAAFHRDRFRFPVVAITGSNGKTTTKEMTAAVASTRFRTLSTVGNLNNDIGLPLTLFNLTQDHELAVLELGTNHPGEIERLAEICRPDIGVITNIGPGHLEGLGSIEGVMREKGELLGKIKSGGTAVLNADDSRCLLLGKTAPVDVLFFGFSEHAVIKAESLEKTETGTSFQLVMTDCRIPIHLSVPGAFMVSNALAAAAVGSLLRIPPGDVQSGLEHFTPVHGRMHVIETKMGVRIIDDSYNANPVSMEAAITTLSCLKGGCRGFLIAGDMLELGSSAESLHEYIGAVSARSKISRLYAVGRFSHALARGAGNNGMDPEDIFLGSPDEVFQDLVRRLSPDDWVLVKGSRAMELEKLAIRLADWANRSGATPHPIAGVLRSKNRPIAVDKP